MEVSHFVRVMATLISRPVVVMRTQEFSETIEGVLVEVARLLDGAGWVMVGELVLAAAEAAYSPLSIAFLVI